MPPREFVLMDPVGDRAGWGVPAAEAELNWCRLFHELIADFNATALAERQAAALAEAGVPVAV